MEGTDLGKLKICSLCRWSTRRIYKWS
jgi:hypothetical protein